MRDREILNDVNSKLDALDTKVTALETSSVGGVTHPEVQAVVDKEASLEARVSALESGSPNPNPALPPTVVTNADGSVTTTTPATNLNPNPNPALSPTVVTNADGSVTTTSADGSTVTVDASGAVIATTPATNLDFVIAPSDSQSVV